MALTVRGLSPTCHKPVGIKINDGRMLPSALVGRPPVWQGPITHIITFWVRYVYFGKCPAFRLAIYKLVVVWKL